MCAAAWRVARAWPRALRGLSSGPPVSVARAGGEALATLRLHGSAVNTLTPPVLRALAAAVAELEADESVRGAVLVSDRPRAFSAGLDLALLAEAGTAELEAYWQLFQSTWLALLRSRLATAAALEGHAPAAGCILAMACGARFARPGVLIGLNEVSFGLAPPGGVLDLLAHLMGAHRAGRHAAAGLLLESEAALEAGLVTAVAADARAAARRDVEAAAAVPQAARLAVERHARGPLIAALEAGLERDAALFAARVQEPGARTAIRGYLASLQKNGKGAAS